MTTNDQLNVVQTPRPNEPVLDPIFSVEDLHYLSSRTSEPNQSGKKPWIPPGPIKTPPYSSQLGDIPPSSARKSIKASNSTQDLSYGSNHSGGSQMKLTKLSQTSSNQQLSMSFNHLVSDVQGWQTPMNRRVQVAIEILAKLKLHYNRRKSVENPESGLRCIADLTIYRLVAGRLLVEDAFETCILAIQLSKSTAERYEALHAAFALHFASTLKDFDGQRWLSRVGLLTWNQIRKFEDEINNVRSEFDSLSPKQLSNLAEKELAMYFLAADGQIYMNFLESWSKISGNSQNYRLKTKSIHEFMMSYSRGFKPEIAKLFARQLGWKKLWWDHQNIGILFRKVIQLGIDESQKFIAFFSDDYLKRQNCKWEANYAMKTKPADKIYAVLLQENFNIREDTWLRFLFESIGLQYFKCYSVAEIDRLFIQLDIVGRSREKYSEKILPEPETQEIENEPKVSEPTELELNFSLPDYDRENNSNQQLSTFQKSARSNGMNFEEQEAIYRPDRSLQLQDLLIDGTITEAELRIFGETNKITPAAFRKLRQYDDFKGISRSQLMNLYRELYYEYLKQNGIRGSSISKLSLINFKNIDPKLYASAQNWTSDDVQIWLENIGMEHLSSEFRNYSGLYLLELLSIYYKAPQAYYDHVDRKLNITNSEDILLLTYHLRRLRR